VAPGDGYDLSLSFEGPAPALSVSFLDATGAVVARAPLSPTALAGQLADRIDVPAGVSTLRIGLAAAPGAGAGQTTWVDDVWLW
jgi:hypothetical protein